MLTRLKKTAIEKPDLSWTRRRWGRGFQYFDEEAHKITSKRTLRRIKKLVIPPMWHDVKISRSPRAKIQATGRDKKGRKQYRYHPDWTRRQQLVKFRRMYAFGRQLPIIRERAHQALSQKGWTREKVLALMVLILDQTGIRIGNRQYLDANNTYGLTTLRRRHLDHVDDELVFSFRGKSGKDREVHIEDAALISYIRKAAELPGYEIFRYRGASGGWVPVDSDEINDYIQSHLGAGFSSKDFRTWVANRILIASQAEAQQIKSRNPRRSLKTILVRLVADALGNTPAVCQNSYLHPQVLSWAVQAPELRLGEVQELKPEHSQAELLLLKQLGSSMVKNGNK